MQIQSIAASGMMAAQSRLEASAIRTAQAPLDNLAAESVEQVSAKVAFQANAAVLRSANETTGTLLNILA